MSQEFKMPDWDLSGELKIRDGYYCYYEKDVNDFIKRIIARLSFVLEDDDDKFREAISEIKRLAGGNFKWLENIPID